MYKDGMGRKNQSLEKDLKKEKKELTESRSKRY
jgi:hypothetical protein